MATYVIGDVHNSLKKLNNIVEKISPLPDDHIYLLGDLFDRGGAEPDPVGVYFRVIGLNSRVTWLRGNHDQMLADYIYQYLDISGKKQRNMQDYRYNSFKLMQERITDVDLLNIADQIMKLPLQIELEVDAVKYLLAHAMTFDPANGVEEARAYLEGGDSEREFLRNGITGYVSFIGHRDTSYQIGNPNGHYLDERANSIWMNDSGNVYMMDCGCGLPGGRLACMCLETGERFYS